MDKHETLKHRGYLKILGGNWSQVYNGEQSSS